MIAFIASCHRLDGKVSTLFVWLMQYILRNRQTWYRRYYLNSRHWQRRAQRARRMAGYMCQRCKREGVPLDVHHRNYEHLFHERASDLVVLCRKCHERMHA